MFGASLHKTVTYNVMYLNKITQINQKSESIRHHLENCTYLLNLIYAWSLNSAVLHAFKMNIHICLNNTLSFDQNKNILFLLCYLQVMFVCNFLF